MSKLCLLSPLPLLLAHTRAVNDDDDMDADYKGHHIKSVARYLPDSDRWTAHVVINWTDRSHERFSQFDVKRGFATEEEAEQAGLELAKKWIDNGKPRLR